MTMRGIAGRLQGFYRRAKLERRLRREHPDFYRVEFARLDDIEDRFTGRRAFLVGSGPSLAAMDLRPLAGEFVCTVNMGLKGIGDVLPHVDMHVVFDRNRLARFATEFEAIAARHDIAYRFYKWVDRDIWQAARVDGPSRPYFILQNKKIKHGIHGVSPKYGISDGGSTSLIGAAQLLFFLGFSEVYVIGCDLSYGSAQTYFYAMDSRDLEHEADEKVQEARRKMMLANEHFATVRDLFERSGRSLMNAGVDSNLTALPPVDFASLFVPPA
jgi:hypothetical protein